MHIDSMEIKNNFYSTNNEIKKSNSLIISSIRQELGNKLKDKQSDKHCYRQVNEEKTKYIIDLYDFIDL